MSPTPIREEQFSRDELVRYSRHLLLPEFGIEGQQALRSSSVLIVGAGGLGSPAAMYLAAAGVGTIGIVDSDVVDLSNLQRQLLHTTADVGRSKSASAKETIGAINPHVEIRTFETRLESGNALDILSGFDVILDGTDNFPTRYLLNDACVLLGKPNVYGSVFRFEGQVSVFFPKQGGPCYRCLFPAPPPPGLVPSCAEGGVLGVLPGIIGSLQALSTIQLIAGLPGTLIGKLLLFDALGMTTRELHLNKNRECPACGDHPTIHTLIDYEEFCGVAPTGGGEGGSVSARPADAISVEELKARIDRGVGVFLLDVREPREYAICNLGGVLIPLGELHRRTGELDPSTEIVVHCKSGIRSAAAITLLRRKGFSRLLNLEGGISAWAERIDPGMPAY